MLQELKASVFFILLFGLVHAAEIHFEASLIRTNCLCAVGGVFVVRLVVFGFKYFSDPASKLLI